VKFEFIHAEKALLEATFEKRGNAIVDDAGDRGRGARRARWFLEGAGPLSVAG
jgi:hypothetical protein